MRLKGDVEGVATVLSLACRSNFGGSENAALYSECYYGTSLLRSSATDCSGTKVNLDEYVEEVDRSLAFVRASDALSADDKHTLLRSLSKNYGSTALCLSGGARCVAHSVSPLSRAASDIIILGSSDRSSTLICCQE